MNLPHAKAWGIKYLSNGCYFVFERLNERYINPLYVNKLWKE